MHDKVAKLFPEARLRHGQCELDGCTVDSLLDDVPIHFTRRRYGRRATFCWALAYLSRVWVSLGDPWQKVTPSRSDLRTAIERARNAGIRDVRPPGYTADAVGCGEDRDFCQD